MVTVGLFAHRGADVVITGTPEGAKSASAETITRSVALLWQTWALALALTVAIAAVF